ncbi:hypothetical protein CYMTET_20628, partial [Cymbomonas tetramitiformis]
LAHHSLGLTMSISSKSTTTLQGSWHRRPLATRKKQHRVSKPPECNASKLEFPFEDCSSQSHRPSRREVLQLGVASAFLACIPESANAEALLSCTAITPDWCEPGFKRFSIAVNGLDVACWVYGDLKHSTQLPLVVVHGGPGFPHTYLQPLAQLACDGRPVIFYDQVCVGESECVADLKRDAPWTLTIDYYLAELADVIEYFDLPEKGYHVLGHSWGSVVAQLYALRQPAGLQGLVLAGAISDAQLYKRAQEDFILSTLPPHIQAAIDKAERDQQYDTELYAAIAEGLTSFYTVRTSPKPDCVQSAFDNVNEQIYTAIQGPSEFTIGGKLKNWSITHKLAGIQVPTLLTNGKYDTMQPPVTDAMAEAIPNVQRQLFERSGHMTMVDEPGPYNVAVQDFLSSLELK